MSCMWCKHFAREISDEQSKLNGLKYLELPGNCTLQPTHIQVSGNHYCSSFMLGARSGYGQGGSLIADWWLAHVAECEKIEELRAEVKRLKDANRQLRNKAAPRPLEPVSPANAANSATPATGRPDKT